MTKTTDIHVNPHLLGHYFTSQALSNPNAPEINAMHWLGHKNLHMTASYSPDTKPASMKLYPKLKVLDGTKLAK
ncbi:site-specific integrase [Loigolactobacillus jiayinensis]|uniref:Integrase n=1 Tax=Loigolactobacillus jiayinensis TaxID=2486016 RepID=A0ABW1RA10_9LACO|nr:hypothetical protein [Loigolactobacillus jiayinensis]